MEAADLDVLSECAQWVGAGHTGVLVTVIRTWGSSPRPAGAMLAIRDDGLVRGSVSGGCIEDDLVMRVQRDGVDAQLPNGLPTVITYGVTADEAHRFGLPCGGTLQLALEKLRADSGFDALVARLSQRSLTRRTLDFHTGHVTVADAAPGSALAYDGDSLSVTLGARYRMLVIGAGQLSHYLCQTAVGLGFDVTVCDPRIEYTEGWSLPDVPIMRDMPDDTVLALHPDERTAVLALTHDPKLDDMALLEALNTSAFYVGALGSRANNDKRRQRLREHFGASAAQLARLRGPVGLYIGSRTPPEIAVSILAEVIAAKNGVELPAAVHVAEAKDAIAAPAGAAVCGTPVEHS